MHDEAITKAASLLLPYFARFPGFYLVGGTALALQIGHRLSVDFDFFSESALPVGHLRKVRKVFADHQMALTYRAPEQLNLTIDEVRVTFFHYPYRLIEPLTSYKGISVSSVTEIALMKAFSIGKRLSYKDYVDWYFLIRDRHVSLTKVIELAEKKFGPDFNDRLFLGQLSSLEDIPVQKIEFLREGVDRATIQAALQAAVKELI